MHGQRPYVLTIAGFDPSSGAGLTADIKTFEQNRVYGLAICTGLTLQTENQFFSVRWRDIRDVQNELNALLEKYPVTAVKFGIVPSIDWLIELTGIIHQKSAAIQIVVDPVWKSSTGFEFASFANREKLVQLLQNIVLITPNLDELTQMSGNQPGEKGTTAFLADITRYTNVLVKGGHDAEKTGTDVFYDARLNNSVGQEKKAREIKPNAHHVFPKHGSGCVLASAITAHLALQYDVFDACVNGKRYTETFLSSNESLLGYHVA